MWRWGSSTRKVAVREQGTWYLRASLCKYKTISSAAIPRKQQATTSELEIRLEVHKQLQRKPEAPSSVPVPTTRDSRVGWLGGEIFLRIAHMFARAIRSTITLYFTYVGEIHYLPVAPDCGIFFVENCLVTSRLNI